MDRVMGAEVTTDSEPKTAEVERGRVRKERGRRPKTKTGTLSLEIITVP